MKKLLAVGSLILFLSFPVLAGHTVPGNFYCNCTNPEHIGWGIVIEDETDIQQDEAPGDEVSELDIFIDTLLLMIRF